MTNDDMTTGDDAPRRDDSSAAETSPEEAVSEPPASEPPSWRFASEPPVSGPSASEPPLQDEVAASDSTTSSTPHGAEGEWTESPTGSSAAEQPTFEQPTSQEPTSQPPTFEQPTFEQPPTPPNQPPSFGTPPNVGGPGSEQPQFRPQAPYQAPPGGAYPPPPYQPGYEPAYQAGSQPRRVLRRSSTDRVAAGVAGGLGEFFGIDPVIFRVLFATSAFFGGAGIIAYLIAWAAIPESGTVNAPIDRVANDLRRRRVPVRVLAAIGVLVIWGALFSWWAPWPFFPVVIAAIILLAALNRRTPATPPGYSGGYPTHGYPPGGYQASGYPAPGNPAPGYPTSGNPAPGNPAPGNPPAGYPTNEYQATSDLNTPSAGGPAAPSAPMFATPVAQQTGTAEHPATDQQTAAFPIVGQPAPSTWTQQVTAQRSEWRVRRERTRPIRLGTLLALLVAIVVLGIIDAFARVPITAYFWTAGAVLLGGLITGIGLRRAPWGMFIPLIPIAIVLIGLGGSDASFGDGAGNRAWTPTSSNDIDGHYRLAFGHAVLDLRQATPLKNDQTTAVTMGAGSLVIKVPKNMNVTVDAHVHAGVIQADSQQWTTHGPPIGGMDVSRDINPPTQASGPHLIINAKVSDGRIAVQRY